MAVSPPELDNVLLYLNFVYREITCYNMTKYACKLQSCGNFLAVTGSLLSCVQPNFLKSHMIQGNIELLHEFLIIDNRKHSISWTSTISNHKNNM